MPDHTYYTSKARAVIKKAGGDPDNAGPLAKWAQQLKESGEDTSTRAIVAKDGAVLCTAKRRGTKPEGPTAFYIDNSEFSQKHGVAGTESGLAIGVIMREIGQPVIEVSGWEVCQGPQN